MGGSFSPLRLIIFCSIFVFGTTSICYLYFQRQTTKKQLGLAHAEINELQSKYQNLLHESKLFVKQHLPLLKKWEKLNKKPKHSSTSLNDDEMKLIAQLNQGDSSPTLSSLPNDETTTNKQSYKQDEQSYSALNKKWTDSVKFIPPHPSNTAIITFLDLSDKNRALQQWRLKQWLTGWVGTSNPVVVVSQNAQLAEKIVTNLIDANNIQGIEKLWILQLEIQSTSLGYLLAKRQLSQLFAHPSFIGNQIDYVLFIDSSLSLTRSMRFANFFSWINQNYHGEDVGLFVIPKTTQEDLKFADSRIFLVSRQFSDDFLDLWGNFMEMSAFHSQTDDSVPLSFVFKSLKFDLLKKPSSPTTIDALVFHDRYTPCDNDVDLTRCVFRESASRSPGTFDAIEYGKIPEYIPPSWNTTYKDIDGNPVDWLIAVKEVTCTNVQQVEYLNRYFNPRMIIYMAVFPDTCQTLVRLAKNVRCIWENHVIPGVSKPVLQSYVNNRDAKKRAGWYLLQIMNMGAYKFKYMSEYYVVWDGDNFPISPMPLFNHTTNQVIYYVGDEHGRATSVGYHSAYSRLTGLDPVDPPDDEKSVEDTTREGCCRPTWVAHFMVFKKEYVSTLIDNIVKYTKSSDWVREIMKVVDRSSYPKLGFGEYDAYGFHLKQFYKSHMQVEMESWRKCKRLMWAPPEYEEGSCCIPLSTLQALQKEGFHYVVREYGENCDLTNSP